MARVRPVDLLMMTNRRRAVKATAKPHGHPSAATLLAINLRRPRLRPVSAYTPGSAKAAALLLLNRRRGIVFPPPVLIPLSINIYRARFGDTITLSFLAAETPIVIPTAILYAGPKQIMSFPVPLIKRRLTFGWSFKVPVGTPLGTLTLVVTFAGVAHFYSASAQIALVPGGDTGGRVISLCGYTKPEGRHFLAHLDTGILVQGSNPHL